MLMSDKPPIESERADPIASKWQRAIYTTKTVQLHANHNHNYDETSRSGVLM